jgi:hypothetical protein
MHFRASLMPQGWSLPCLNVVAQPDSQSNTRAVRRNGRQMEFGNELELREEVVRPDMLHHADDAARAASKCRASLMEKMLDYQTALPLPSLTWFFQASCTSFTTGAGIAT